LLLGIPQLLKFVVDDDDAQEHATNYAELPAGTETQPIEAGWH
jgi:hypothetical protein